MNETLKEALAVVKSEISDNQEATKAFESFLENLFVSMAGKNTPFEQMVQIRSAILELGGPNTLR